MAKKQKLELTWIGKDRRPKLEPRVLIEDPEKSYHAAERCSDEDIFDNILIKGDNLLALKALEADYAGKVKCIFIDPPYNTGSAFEHYEDGLEHSIWLELMFNRLKVLRNLLSQDGSIFVSIDFNEVHYLKVLMDEIFGRNNFQREIIWRIGWLSGYKTSAKNFIRNHDTILYYAKNSEKVLFNKQYIERKDFTPRFSASSLKELRARLKDKGLSATEIKEFLNFAQETGLPERYPLEDTWNCSIYDRLNSIAVVSYSGESISKMLGVQELKGQKSEALIHRILASATMPGDIVLDSFAGTGTTGAVAQKMGRRWIMVELGEHCDTHIAPRLRKVIDGEDQGGVTKTANWGRGGGYRYYTLAPSLLEKDAYGNWVINKKYNPVMLAEAVCKLMGFIYSPSLDQNTYWQHGHSTETDFIYVTTRALTQSALTKLSLDVGPERTLKICCKAFKGKADIYDNLTIEKIPRAVLKKCEWDHDDYSLNVANLPMVDEHADLPLLASSRRKRKDNS